MFVTSLAVSAGFLLLVTSNSQAVVDIGILIGITLFFAVFADLFLSPLLVMKLKPPLGSRKAERGSAGDEPARSGR